MTGRKLIGRAVRGVVRTCAGLAATGVFAGVLLAAAPAEAAPRINGGPRAGWEGAWGPVIDWPLVAIHSAVLPNGKVLTYGTDGKGSQGAVIYDLWDPSKGVGPGSHQTLRNRTTTDIFCSAQLVLPRGNDVLIAGGDVTIDGERNYSSNDFNVLNWRRGTLSKRSYKFRQGRWYPTMTALPNGEVLLHGGRARKYDPTRPGNTLPEIYNRSTGWRTLPGAKSDAAYAKNWYYPWSFVTPRGQVLFTKADRKLWELNWRGRGSIKQVGQMGGPWRSAGSAALINSGYKVLVTGGHAGGEATATTRLIDLNDPTYPVTDGPSMSQPRTDHDSTVLPGGRVLITGGSAEWNKLVGTATRAEAYEPWNNRFVKYAQAKTPRLYHSTTVLLPDATVLTAGGGSPGPLTNLNAEIFYPPYLFKKDGSGQMASRPVIRSLTRPRHNQTFTIDLNIAASRVKGVSMVSLGSSTHAFDMGQRRVWLNIAGRSGKRLTVNGPWSRNIAPPGYYMVFVFNENWVPSVSKIISL